MIKIKKVANNSFDRKVRNLIKADNQKVDVGIFSAQGVHSSTGKLYSEMMSDFHWKYAYPRKILTLLVVYFVTMNEPSVVKIRENWFRNQSAEYLLEGLGKLMATKLFSLFGVVNEPLMPAAGDAKKTPLLETGELQSKSSYRTTLNNKITEV